MPVHVIVKTASEKEFKVIKNEIFEKSKNAVWDNTKMMKDMKFCTPPRFLIVEVNL